MRISLLMAIILTATYGYSQKVSSSIDSLSYSLGVVVAENLKHQGIEDIDTDLFSEAIKHVIHGDQTAISSEDAQKIILDYQKKKQEMAGEAAKKEGEKFLAENGKREGVVTLESGLQYEVVKEGNGAKPGAEDEVTVHYEGRLIDGSVFDSSIERGEPSTFRLDRVIKGWTEVLQLMPEGSKWRVYIPENLAYGSRGAGAMIKPFSTLIFDIELIEVH